MSVITGIHHAHLNPVRFQNTSTPDINLERDIISLDENLLGMAAVKNLESEQINGNKKLQSKFRINVATILVSALIFLSILAWFDFIQTTIYAYLDPDTTIDTVPSYVKLWYAIFITFLVVILIALIYIYNKDVLT